MKQKLLIAGSIFLVCAFAVTADDSKVYFKGDAGVYRRNGMIPVINPANSPKFKLDNLLKI